MTSRTQKQAARAYIEANPGTPYIVALNHIKKRPAGQAPRGHMVTFQNPNGTTKEGVIHNVYIYPTASGIYPLSTSFPAVWINTKTGHATYGWAHLSEKNYWEKYSEKKMTLKEIVFAASADPALVFIEDGHLTSMGDISEGESPNYIHESALYQLHNHPDEPISAWIRWEAGGNYHTVDPWIIEKLGDIQHRTHWGKLKGMIELLSARFVRFCTEATTIDEDGTTVEALWFNPRTLCLTYGYAKTRARLSNPLDLRELAFQNDLTLWEKGYVYPTQGGVRAANIIPAHIYPVIQAVYGKEDVALEGWDKWGYALSIKTGHESEFLPQSYVAGRITRLNLMGATLPRMRDEKNVGHVVDVTPSDMRPIFKIEDARKVSPTYSFNPEFSFGHYLSIPFSYEGEDGIRKAHAVMLNRQKQVAESEEELDFDSSKCFVFAKDNQSYPEDVERMVGEIARRGRSYGVHCYIAPGSSFSPSQRES